MRLIFVAFIKLWRKFISPLYGQVCKYHPSCSEYGLEAVQLHGSLAGSVLIIRRLIRCNPFSKGGVDFVPKSPRWFEWEEIKRERAGQTGCSLGQGFADGTIEFESQLDSDSAQLSPAIK